MTKTIIDAIKEYDKSFNQDILYDLEKYNQYNEKIDGEIIRIRTFMKDFLSTWQKTDKITGDAAALIELSTYEKESLLLQEKVKTIEQEVIKSLTESKLAADELLRIGVSFTEEDKRKVNTWMRELNTRVTNVRDLYTEIGRQHTLLKQSIDKVLNKTTDIRELGTLIAKIREIAAKAETTADNVYKKKADINAWKEKQVEIEEVIKKNKEQNIPKYINEINSLKEKVKTLIPFVHSSFLEAKASADALLRIGVSFTEREKEDVNTLVSKIDTLKIKANELYKEIEEQHKLVEQSHNIEELEALMVKIREIAVKAETNANDVDKKTAYIKMWENDQPGVEAAIKKEREQTRQDKAKIEAARAQGELDAQEKHDKYDDKSTSGWWGWGGHRIKKNSHKSIRKNHIKKYSIKRNMVIKRKSLSKSLPYKYNSIKKVR